MCEKNFKKNLFSFTSGMGIFGRDLIFAVVIINIFFVLFVIK
jgi:hypothetical protein